MHSIDTDVDVLAGWVARRERQHRGLMAAWAVLSGVCGLLSLLTEQALYAPAVPLLSALAWLVGSWGSDRWWAMRTRWAGHPVVRADAAWTVASDRPLPLGWPESPVNGTLHRMDPGWLWRPSRLVAADLPVRFWAADDVAAVTVTPLWNPLLPPLAQVRLYLRGGGSVELIVHRPERIVEGPLTTSAGTCEPPLDLS